MTLVEIPSLEEGTSKEKEGWRMAVTVVTVEVAVQILAACMFVKGRKAAELVMGSQSGMHKGTVSAAHPPKTDKPEETEQGQTAGSSP